MNFKRFHFLIIIALFFNVFYIVGCATDDRPTQKQAPFIPTKESAVPTDPDYPEWISATFYHRWQALKELESDPKADNDFDTLGITVKWSKVQDSGSGSGLDLDYTIDYYTIVRSDKKEFSMTNNTTYDTLEFIDKNQLVKGTPYYYHINVVTIEGRTNSSKKSQTLILLNDLKN